MTADSVLPVKGQINVLLRQKLALSGNLTCLYFPRAKENWSDYETAALPAELRRHFIGKIAWAERFMFRFSRCYSTVGLVKQCKPTKTWERTGYRNLLRHKSGRYYARAFSGGNEVCRSFKTSHFSVAQAKLAEFLREHWQRVAMAA